MRMNILVLNAGSSSLKYQLINAETHTLLARGLCDRVGSKNSEHKHWLDDNEVCIHQFMPDHDSAIGHVLDILTRGEHRSINSLNEIHAVGHRIVQGGIFFNRSVLIEEDVIEKIDELAELAPLHNKAALQGIYGARHHMPHTPMVAVFDTSYYQTIPEKFYTYPLPYDLCQKYSIRKYGAHGTSHRYIADRAARLIDEDITDLKLITCHLGNGCSVSAIDHGQAVDTSMGLTPLDGLMMGTRCGSIDPAIVTFLMEKENLSPREMNDLMNRQSGLLGVSGISNDLREVDECASKGNERAILACEMYANSVKKYIGQYMAVMGGVDAIVLAGGVGENSIRMRRMIFEGLQSMGIILDSSRNNQTKGERLISNDSSNVVIIVVPTNEELMIAHDTYEIVHDAVGQGIINYSNH